MNIGRTIIAFRNESGMGRIASYPRHWQRGQLLDHKLFDKGMSRAILLDDPNEKPEYIEFSTREEAQQFISWWYAPASARLQERECQDAPVNITAKQSVKG